LAWPGSPQEFGDKLTTLDLDPNCGADVEWDLERLPLPFPDNHFDEIHAYEILEHVGRQGDWRFFFSQFADFWRMLKPGGLFLGSVPVLDTENEQTDPGHTRRFHTQWLSYLHQPHYDQVGRTMCSDYRHFYTADFDFPIVPAAHGGCNYFGMSAVKPSRIKT